MKLKTLLLPTVALNVGLVTGYRFGTLRAEQIAAMQARDAADKLSAPVKLPFGLTLDEIERAAVRSVKKPRGLEHGEVEGAAREAKAR